MSRKTALYFCITSMLLLWSNAGLAQNCDTLFAEGMTIFRRAELDKAYIKFDLSQDCYARSRQWEEFVRCHKGMSFILFRTGKPEQVPTLLLPVLDTLNKYAQQSSDYNTLLTSIYNSLGGVYTELGHIDKAIHYMDKVLQMANDAENKIIAYNNLGVTFQKKLDDQKSIHYYRKALDILEDTFAIENREILKGRAFINLAVAYRYHRNYEEALRNFENGIGIIRALETKDDRQKLEKEWLFTEYYFSMGAFYNEWEQYDLALSMLNKIQDAKSGKGKSSFLLKGQAYFGKKDYQEAIHFFNKAMYVENELYLDGKHIKKSIVNLNLGRTYRARKKTHWALSHLQQALIQAVPTFNDTLWANNPIIEDAHYVGTLLEILDAKAKTLSDHYQNTQDEIHLNNSLNTYQTALRLIDKIRIEQQYDESAFSLLRTARPIYEGAIEAAYAAKHPELAYQFMEKSKAVVLLTALRDAGAKITAGIPDTLLNSEKELKIQISYNERRLSEAQLDDKQEKIKEYNAVLFEKREQLQKFLSQLEADYPEYYTIKYNTDVADIDELKNKLKAEKSVAIEYFMGDNTLYACVIDGENIALHQFEKGENFEAALTDFLAVTSNPSSQISDFKTYTHSAALLYQKLLKPILPSTQNILIIPDDRLTYLAFDALIQHPTKGEHKESRYDTLSYLVNQYNINYAYSASVLLEKKPRKSIQKLKPFAGFAPEFSSGKIAEVRGEDLDSLIHNQREVETIQDIVGGTAYINEAATTQDFFAHANEYRILHFATHVIAGDTTQNTGHRIHLNDSVLLAEDIYNASLNADLVVLSACETGQGELIEGEGVMSLARAFRYTGCPSLTASLWSVDDKSTANIMIDFYKNIYKEQAQNQALANSKRTYLQELNTYEKAHPFYWAGFVHVGDTSAIALAGNSMQWLWWVLGFVVLLGLWRWLR